MDAEADDVAPKRKSSDEDDIAGGSTTTNHELPADAPADQSQQNHSVRTFSIQNSLVRYGRLLWYGMGWYCISIFQRQ